MLNKIIRQVSINTVVFWMVISVLLFINTGRDIGGMIAEEMVRSVIVAVIAFYILTSSVLTYRTWLHNRKSVLLTNSTTVILLVLSLALSVGLGLLSPLM